MIFISLSSLGYVFTGLIGLTIAEIHRKKFNSNNIKAYRYLSIAFYFLSATVLTFGIPPFFTQDSQTLGLLNIPGNIFMGLWGAFITAFTISLIHPKKDIKNWFIGWIGFIVFILIPINYIFLPLPTFDEYTIEIWNYSTPLFLVTAGMIMFGNWYHGLHVLSYLMSPKRSQYEKSAGYKALLPLALAVMIGGIGGVFIVYAHTTELVVAGYLLLFFGGFVASLFSYLK